MRIVAENHKQGLKKLIPESFTDLFLLTRLIDTGDLITAKTHRRVRKSGTMGREGSTGERKSMILSIKTEDVHFQDSEVDQRLRIKGKIHEGPQEYVSLGSTHTINVNVGKMLTIVKESWNAYHKKVLKDMVESVERPPIALIAIERGIATIGLVNNFHLQILNKTNINLPGKVADANYRQQAEKKFFKRIIDVLRFQLPSNAKYLVVGGHGKIKDDFIDYLKGEWNNREIIIRAENITSGTQTGLQEIINRGIIDQIASDYIIVKETKILEKFDYLLLTEPEKTSYGMDEVLKNLEMGAVDVCLITDDLIRTFDGELRAKIDQIIQLCNQTRVDLLVVDSKSQNGKKVEIFGKIMGLLRFSVYE